MIKKILIIIFIICIGLFIFFSMINNNYCKDEAHRGIYPVNPYCTKCHDRDGVKKHECKNPNGKDKYCSSCGKKLKQ
ncbi:MAG: hypothetical protein J6J60_00465 [Clostridia bacterium]|nr:hypothetical protein [Clostridia bacterium]